jgi:hypothetical protein
MGGGGDDEVFGPFEADIAKLPGVTHARVVQERGRITEIHVVSDGFKDARQLKRDIETLAMAKYALEIDHRIISISTLPDVDIRTAGNRLELVSVSVTTASGIAVCNVVARRGDEISEGSSTGGASMSGLPKIVARAALEAASKVLGYSLPAEIANALFVAADEHRIATIALIFVDEQGEPTVVPGTANVRGDQNEAIASAVIYAVNRHLRM